MFCSPVNLGRYSLTNWHIVPELSRRETVSRRGASVIQGESLARGPKLLSIKNYVIEIMT